MTHGQALIDTLVADAAAMRAAMARAGGTVLAEGLAMALAGHMPLADAPALVERAVLERGGRCLPQALRAITDPGLDWDRLSDPAHHVGQASALIDRVLARV